MIFFLFLTACSHQERQGFDILEHGDSVSLVMNQALSIHHRFERGLSVQALDSLYMKTVETVDFKGKPFINITFTAPKPIGDLWVFADGLKGNEWSYDDFETPWTTTLIGASTVRDVLVTSNEGLALVMQMGKTIKVMGGKQNLKNIVAFDLQNFILQDIKGNFWNIEEARTLTNSEVTRLKKVYEDIYNGNNSPEAAAIYQNLWKKTKENSEAHIKSLNYSLSDFTTSEGTLDLAKVKTAINQIKADPNLAPQTITDGGKTCIFWICEGYQYGQLGPTPLSYTGLQASQGGFPQSPSDYDYATFNSIACITNTNVNNTLLGCGPSAFIGLVGRKFNDGAVIDGMRKSTHLWNTLKKRMVDPVGVNGRPRIANYMGTCVFGGGGLTTGDGFLAGAKRYLLDAKAKRSNGVALNAYGHVSHYLGNIADSNAKADILMQEVGRENNPVVAEYFIGNGQGHYTAIAKYWVRQGVTSYVDIQTADHPGRWWSLTGGWGTERGVFYID